MTQSQDAAAIAALRYLDLPVTLYTEVNQVQAGAPADGKLEVGDVIRTVDGVKVSAGTDVTTAVRKVKPGDVIEFGIERKGKPMTVSVTSEPSPDDPKVPYVGIGLQQDYTSPVKISIKLNDVGGPSGGLMFTMGIIDKLTAGSVNAGQHVAGTGTMDENGNVGAIGGIRQKIAAAKADGATIFMVPEANCSEAVVGAPEGLRLVKVSTLTGALDALKLGDLRRQPARLLASVGSPASDQSGLEGRGERGGEPGREVWSGQHLHGVVVLAEPHR